jgi:hypothetical protein
MTPLIDGATAVETITVLNDAGALETISGYTITASPPP